MKKATRSTVSHKRKRNSNWAKIVPLSRIAKPYTGVIVHKGTAY